MTTFFLDVVGGNDANDGTTFANRWLTCATGATAARTAPGDTIRIMASPNETDLGINATWTQNSKTVTLASALTQMITDCGTLWTVSTNVTRTTTATRKEGTLAISIAIGSAFTTGLVAFFATGTLDLSAYKQVTFWIQNSTALAASTLSLRLCSDAAGVTTVNTIAIPAIPSFAQFVPFTVDTGAALGTSIQSIALYADLDPGSLTVILDDIQACKDSTAADSLSLTSLVGKVHNLSWVASTVYATNDKRRPTQPNRNGFQYKVTAGGGGSSGSSEPTWPLGIGLTVTGDGALTWTCEELEDTWYPIQSINGTTVLIDNDVNTLATAGRGYSASTETVRAYKREPIKYAVMEAAGGTYQTVQESGTAAGGNITYSGGWDRTNMSVQSGETWLDGQNGVGELFYANAKGFLTFNNLNGVRAFNLVRLNAVNTPITCLNMHAAAMTSQSIVMAAAPRMFLTLINVHLTNGVATGAFAHLNFTAGRHLLRRVSTNGGLAGGITVLTNTLIDAADVSSRNNALYGMDYGAGVVGGQNQLVKNLTTGNNASGAINAVAGGVVFNNSLFPESTKFAALTAFADGRIYSNKHDQTAGNHLSTLDGGTITSATDQRHTASGISWKFLPTSVNRSIGYPMRLSLARVGVAANALVTVSVWTRRDNTNINGILIIPAGQISGCPPDLQVACAPTINTWVQSGTLTFTPSEAGVVEIFFYVYDGIGTTAAFWIDDLSVVQA